jgi:hypothetical protein
LPKVLPPVDPSFKVKRYVDVVETEERIMCTSLGVHVNGAINFWPDTSSQDGALLGAMKRIATQMPDYDEETMNEFLEFSFKFIVDNFQDCVLEPDTDLSVPTWLAGTDYKQSRKDELQKVWDEYVILLKKHLDVMCHNKYESYTTAKFFRCIYSRSDLFKCYFGPVCAEIGTRMFQHVWFAKYLSVDAKIARMSELFENEFIRMFSNDFTSFEATFCKAIMAVELFFFAFCTQHLPNTEEMMEVLEGIKQGENHLIFRTFQCLLRCKRYSGEMDTSLSNSIVNLCLICFMLHKAGHDKTFYEVHFPPQVEGDDSLGAHIYDLDPNLLLKLGANAKLEFFDSFNEASFCGVVFGSADGSVIKEPISVILNFGLVNFRYLNCSELTRQKLIRAKSLSMLYSYPGCPILKNLALMGLRVTSGIANRSALWKMYKGDDNNFRRRHWIIMLSQDFQMLADRPVDPVSRDMMESKFGVSIGDQLDLEAYFDSINVKQPLSHPLILAYAGVARTEHFDKFTCVIKRKTP